MELRIFSEPQWGASYETQLAAAKVAEESGFSAYFRSDHYQTMGPAAAETMGGLPGPTDSWVTLGALARETSRIRLGTLMTSATFRLPGPLAISVAQVDAMSGGRVELGLGAGWYGLEHVSYGIPFPPSATERFDRLEEQLAVVTGLWKTPLGERFNFRGAHYTLSESPALPKPLQQPHPPLIIGGRGLQRTPALAARFAAEHNSMFDKDRMPKVYDALARACEAEGRDPQSLVRSSIFPVVCGETRSEIDGRLARAFMPSERLVENGSSGTPLEIAGELERRASFGITRVYLQLQDLTDLDQIRLLGERLIPLVASF